MNNDIVFFKPTKLYKEYMILDLIEKKSNLTQREIAVKIGVSHSMINEYLHTFELKGLITKIKYSTKSLEYIVTKLGRQRRKLLNVWYLQYSNKVYSESKENIVDFLIKILKKDFKKVILYGAGEFTEIILNAMYDVRLKPLEIVSIIDDNESKNSNVYANYPVISLKEISKYKHDALMISSYRYHTKIYKKLLNIGYPENKIIHFFEI